MKQTVNKAYSNCAEKTQAAAFKRLIKTYDLAIEAGIAQNKENAEHVVSFLEATLNDELNPDLVLSLRAIYQDCHNQLNNHHWAQYTESMERLKALWIAYDQSLQLRYG